MLERAEILEVVSGHKKWPHPVVEVIDSEFPAIQQTIDAVFEMHHQEGSVYITRNLGFLADAVEKIGEFPLKPLDLAAIGRRLDQITSFPEHITLTLVGDVARIACCAFAVNGAPNNLWAGFPRYYLLDKDHPHNKLPVEVIYDRESLLYVRERVGQIDQSVNQLFSASYNKDNERIDNERIAIVDSIGQAFYSPTQDLLYNISKALRNLGVNPELKV